MMMKRALPLIAVFLAAVITHKNLYLIYGILIVLVEERIL